MSSNHSTKKEIVTANQKTIVGLLQKVKPQMKMALPAHMTADRMCRIALTELRKTPKLMECDPMSFVGAVMVCASLGLEIGTLGQAYLVPFVNRKLGTTECTFILGYKGMIDLARRSGQIISLSAHCVYEKDEFFYEYGLEDNLKHIPSLTEKGSFKAAYAVAKLVGGGYQFEVMSKPDIEAIKKKSKSGNFGPWVTDFDEMAKKTAIRRLFKYLPTSIEMKKAVSYEEISELPDANVIDLLEEDYDMSFISPDETATASSVDVSAMLPQSDQIAKNL